MNSGPRVCVACRGEWSPARPSHDRRMKCYPCFDEYAKRWYGLQDRKRRIEDQYSRRGARARRRERILLSDGTTIDDLLARDGANCYLCHHHISREVHHLHPKAATREHVFPLARGGHDTADNLRVACRECNTRKATRLLSELDLPWVCTCPNCRTG